MSTTYVSRRTVARGVAWSRPIATLTNTTTNVTGSQIPLDLGVVKFDPCKAADTYASCV